MADIILEVGGDVRSLEKEINRLSKKKLDLVGGGAGAGKFSNPLGRITGQLGEFEKALDASNARVLAFGASAGALFAVQKGLRAILDASIDVEAKLADINVILNASGKNLDKFSNSLFGVAKNTANSFSTVAEAATELARQGLTVEDTLKRTSDALILTRLSGMKATDAVEAITAALNSFSRAAMDSSKFVSKLAAVDAAFAVSSKDLAEAVKRVGSSAQEAGLGIDELIAAVTAAQQITARGGAVIGNSFKTIFTRIQRPRVIKELENLGIAVHGLGGTVKPAMQILSELAKTYDNLGVSQRAQVAELIGGVFQVNVLKASLRDLSKEFSLYKNALEISNAATDEAARRNEELNKTVSATLSQTVANLTNFGSKIGQVTFGPAIKKVLGGINSAIEGFDVKNPEGIGEKIGAGVLGGIGKFLEGPGILVVGMTLIKTFSRLAQQVTDAFKTISGLGSASSKQLDTQKKISNALANDPSMLSKIEAGTLSVAEAHRDILYILQQEEKAQLRNLAIIQDIARLDTRGGSRIAGVGKGRSSGHVPNFANNQKPSKDKVMKQQELSSASYAKSSTRAIKDTMPGLGTYYRNSAEEKKKVPGFVQPFINPPKNSLEGEAHRIKSIKKTGLDPYKLSSGFVPNFVMSPADRIRAIEKHASKVESVNHLSEVLGVPRATLKHDLGLSPQGQGEVVKNSGKAKELKRIGAMLKKKGLDKRNSMSAIALGNEFEKQFAKYFGISRRGNSSIDFKGIPQNKKRKKIKMEGGYTSGDTIWGTRGHGDIYMADKILNDVGGFRLPTGKPRAKIDLGNHNITEILGQISKEKQSGLVNAKMLATGKQILNEKNLSKKGDLRKLATKFPNKQFQLGYKQDYVTFGSSVQEAVFGKGKNKSSGLIPNFASKGDIDKVAEAMKFIPRSVLTGETMRDMHPLGKTTKRLDTSVYGLNPASKKKFSSESGSQYLTAVQKTAGKIFGSNYNSANFTRVTDKANIGQTRGFMLQDMIGGLAGKSGGASGGPIDLSPGTLQAIQKRHPNIARSFTPGLFNEFGGVEIKSTMGATKGTSTQDPADLVKKGVNQYLLDTENNIGRSLEERGRQGDLLKRVRNRLKASKGFVPNFMSIFRGGRKKTALGKLGQFSSEHDSLGGKSMFEVPETVSGLQEFLNDLTNSRRVGGFMSASSKRKLAESFAKKGVGGQVRGTRANLGMPKNSKLSFGIKTLRAELGREPTNDEIYKATGFGGGRLSAARADIITEDEIGTVAEFNIRNRTLTLKKLKRYISKLQVRDKHLNPENIEKNAIKNIFKMAGLGTKGGKAVGFNLNNWFKGYDKEIRKRQDLNEGAPFTSESSIFGHSTKSSFPNTLSSRPGEEEISVFAGNRNAIQSLNPKIEELTAKGLIPNFASAKGRKTPLYDLDGTIINEGFFKWNSPEEVLKVTNNDLTPLGKRLKSSKELIDIATARGARDAPHIKKSLGGLGFKIGKVMPLASMFTSQSEMGKRGKPIKLRGPSKKRLIADKLGRDLVDNDPKNIEALGPRGIPYNIDGLGKAGGVIPNFANSLMEAISREKSAGVPVDKIRIGANKSLSSSGNPMGFGVFNTLDEPNGLSQGISRSKSMGIDPKTHGASSGIVPNFAPTLTNASFAGVSEVNRDKLEQAIDQFAIEYRAATDQVIESYKNESEAADSLVAETKSLAHHSGLTGDNLTEYSNVIDDAAMQGKKIAKEQKTIGNRLKKAGSKIKGAFLSPKEGSNTEQRMLGMSMAMPMVTETIKNFGADFGKKTKGALDAVNDLTMTATGITSIMPGPAGMVVAGLLAVHSAAKGWAKTMQDDTTKLTNEVGKSKEKFTKLQNGITAYAQTFSELQAAAKDMNTPAETLIKLDQKLRSLLASVPAEFSMEIAAAGTSAELETTMAKILQKEARAQMQAEISLNIQTNIDEMEGVMTYMADVWGEGSQNMKFIFDGMKGKLNLDRVVADMRKGLDFKDLSKDMGDAAKSQKLENSSRTEFIKILGDQYGATADMQLMLRQLSNSDLKQFQEAVLDSARAAERHAEMQDRLAKGKEDDATRLGTMELKDAIDRLAANTAHEDKAGKKLGGGVEGLINPDSIKGINKAFMDAADVLSSGPLGVMEKGKAMTKLTKSQFDLGEYNPQLDAASGKLDKDGTARRKMYVDAKMQQVREMAIQKNAVLARRRQEAVTTGGAIEGIDLAMRANRRQMQTNQDDRNFVKRGAENQWNEMVGFKEMEAKSFRIGTIRRDAVVDSSGQTIVAEEQKGASIKDELEARGVTSQRKQEGAKREFTRKFEEEIEQYTDSIKALEEQREEMPDSANTSAIDEKIKKQTENKGKIEDALRDFKNPTKGGLANTTMDQMRALGKLGIDEDGNQEQFLTGIKNAISLSGEGETPGQKALRTAMEKLEETERNLAELIKKRVEQEGDTEEDAVISNEQNKIRKVTGVVLDNKGNVDVRATAKAKEEKRGRQQRGVDEFEEADTGWRATEGERQAAINTSGIEAKVLNELYQSDKAMGGDVRSSIGIGEDSYLDSGDMEDAIRDSVKRGKGSTDALFKQMIALMPELREGRSFDELEDLSLDEIRKEIKDFNVRADASGDKIKRIDGVENLAKFVQSMATVSGEEEGVETNRLLQRMWDGAKDQNKSTAQMETYLDTVAGWNNPGTAAVTIHGDKIGLLKTISSSASISSARIASKLGGVVSSGGMGKGVKTIMGGARKLASAAATMGTLGLNKAYNRVNYGGGGMGGGLMSRSVDEATGKKKFFTGAWQGGEDLRRSRNLARGFNLLNPLGKINDKKEAVRRLKKIKQPGTGFMGVGKKAKYTDLEIEKLLSKKENVQKVVRSGLLGISRNKNIAGIGTEIEQGQRVAEKKVLADKAQKTVSSEKGKLTKATAAEAKAAEEVAKKTAAQTEAKNKAKAAAEALSRAENKVTTANKKSATAQKNATAASKDFQKKQTALTKAQDKVAAASNNTVTAQNNAAKAADNLKKKQADLKKLQGEKTKSGKPKATASAEKAVKSAKEKAKSAKAAAKKAVKIEKAEKAKIKKQGLVGEAGEAKRELIKTDKAAKKANAQVKTAKAEIKSKKLISNATKTSNEAARAEAQVQKAKEGKRKATETKRAKGAAVNRAQQAADTASEVVKTEEALLKSGGKNLLKGREAAQASIQADKTGGLLGRIFGEKKHYKGGQMMKADLLGRHKAAAVGGEVKRVGGLLGAGGTVSNISKDFTLGVQGLDSAKGGRIIGNAVNFAGQGAGQARDAFMATRMGQSISSQARNAQSSYKLARELSGGQRLLQTPMGQLARGGMGNTLGHATGLVANAGNRAAKAIQATKVGGHAMRAGKFLAPGAGFAVGAGIGALEKGTAGEHDLEFKDMSMGRASTYGALTGSARTGGFLANDVLGLEREGFASDAVGVGGAMLHGGFETGMATGGNLFAAGGGAVVGGIAEGQKIRERNEALKSASGEELFKHYMSQYMGHQKELQTGDKRVGMLALRNRKEQRDNAKEKAISGLMKKGGLSEKEAEEKFKKEEKSYAIQEILNIKRGGGENLSKENKNQIKALEKTYNLSDEDKKQINIQSKAQKEFDSQARDMNWAMKDGGMKTDEQSEEERLNRAGGVERTLGDLQNATIKPIAKLIFAILPERYGGGGDPEAEYGAARAEKAANAVANIQEYNFEGAQAQNTSKQFSSILGKMGTDLSSKGLKSENLKKLQKDFAMLGDAGKARSDALAHGQMGHIRAQEGMSGLQGQKAEIEKGFVDFAERVLAGDFGSGTDLQSFNTRTGKHNGGIRSQVEGIQKRRAAGKQISKEELMKLGKSASMGVSSYASSRIKENKIAQAGDMRGSIGGQTIHSLDSAEDKKEVLESIRKGLLAELKPQLEQRQIQLEKEGKEKYRQRVREAAGLEVPKKTQERQAKIKKLESEISQADSDWKASLSGESSTGDESIRQRKTRLIEEKRKLEAEQEEQSRKQQAFIKGPEMAINAETITQGGKDLQSMWDKGAGGNEILQGSNNRDQKEANALIPLIETGQATAEQKKMLGLKEGATTEEVKAAASAKASKYGRDITARQAKMVSDEDRKKKLQDEVNKWKSMGTAERKKAEEAGLTGSQKYAKTAIDRQEAIANQQKMGGRGAAQQKAISAMNHAELGTKGVDYRYGLETDQFDNIVSEEFGGDVAERIKQRRELLTSGKLSDTTRTVRRDAQGNELFGGQAITDKQVVQRKQQEEMAGIYSRFQGKDGAKGPEAFNELLRQAIVDGMATARAEEKKSKEEEEKSSSKPKKDKPEGASPEGGGSSGGEFTDRADGTAQTEIVVKGSHNVSGKIEVGGSLTFEADKQLTEKVEAIFAKMINSGNSFGEVKNKNRPRSEEKRYPRSSKRN